MAVDNAGVSLHVAPAESHHLSFELGLDIASGRWTYVTVMIKENGALMELRLTAGGVTSTAAQPIGRVERRPL